MTSSKSRFVVVACGIISFLTPVITPPSMTSLMAGFGLGKRHMDREATL